MKTIALVGDFDPTVPAHVAIPRALEIARKRFGAEIDWKWFGTDTIRDARSQLAGVGGIWVVPASPYRSLEGALSAIRYAREADIPFLGTCGGFQHMLVEFARNVAGLARADHGETNPEGDELIVTLMACSLVEKAEKIKFAPGSRLSAIFDGKPRSEEYRCRFGLNEAYREKLEAAGMRFSAFDDEGGVRAAELPSRRFYMGMLFQPERSGLRGEGHPLITAFVEAVGRAR